MLAVLNSIPIAMRPPTHPLLATWGYCLLNYLRFLWAGYLKLVASRQKRSSCPALQQSHQLAEPAPLPSPTQLARLISSRRSIYPKHMTGATVGQDNIVTMLEAANWAPTHGLTEPWRFVVLGKRGIEAMQDVTDGVFKSQLADQPEVLQTVLADLQHDRATRWSRVSHMIAICMARQAKPGKLMPFWEELAACACAVQNMHLMATSLGLAAYWSSWHCGARDSPEMLEFLGLNYSIGDRCWGFLVLGAVEPEVAQAYRASRQPVSSKVVWKD